MTDEMAVSRVLDRNVDQAIHNYIVHMKPLRGAFLDVHDRTVATLAHMPSDRVVITGRGVEVDGRVVPVVHQWDRHAAVQDYLLASERFKPGFPGARGASRHSGSPGQAVDGSEAVICYLRPGQGTAKLRAFVSYIRETGYVGSLAIVGVGFIADNVEAARTYRCQLLQVDSGHATRAPEAAAHLYFHELLPQLNADDVFLIDDISAIFVGNPFRAKTIGVSLFAEGAKLIRDCQETMRRLALFGEPVERIAGRQIVSAGLVCGRRAEVRGFYAALFREFEGKAHLLEAPGAVQAAFNRIAWSDHRELPITVRPNGSLAYIARWPTGMTVETEPVLRVGGAAPAVILGRDRTGN
jgi:hypothetical protein